MRTLTDGAIELEPFAPLDRADERALRTQAERLHSALYP